MQKAYACLIGKGSEMRFFPSADKDLQDAGVEFDAVTKIPDFQFAETTKSGDFLVAVRHPRLPHELVAFFRVGSHTVEPLPGYDTPATRLERTEWYIRAHLEEIWRELVHVESVASS